MSSAETARRFERLEILFAEALEQAPENRESWLEERCAAEGWADEGLCSEVLELLEEDQRAEEGRLEAIVDAEIRSSSAADAWAPDPSSAADPDAETLASPADGLRPGLMSSAPLPEADPERVGPYRILGRLGRGGLATVYRAEREGEFAMPVALKRIRQGMDTEDIVERLKLERQILARLVHPNIARIHDGGSDASGRPYLVMEVIEGERLDHWCLEHRPSLEQRLELFEQILEAVDFAHQNLVLHRDLKPSNILVTDEGVPKLLDFGIAKLLSGEVGDPGSAATVTGIEQRLLTPDYASPEQILGQPLTTASDVYSLGIILFELASGISPHRAARERKPTRTAGLGRGAPWAAPVGLAAVPDAFPRVSETAHRARLRESKAAPAADAFVATHSNELDAVVAKTLEADPADRYRSVRELAEDLARLRADLPVLARPISWPYRVRKWVRRHRAAAGVAAIVLLSILSAVVGTTWQARVAEGERQLAETRLLEAEDAVSFLVDIFAVSDPTSTRSLLGTGDSSSTGGAAADRRRAGLVTAREILDQGAARIDLAFAQDPGRRRRIQRAIGSAYLGLSAHDEARRHLEAAASGDTEPREAEAAIALRHLAELDAVEGNFAAAERRLTRASTFFEAAFEPGHPERIRQLEAWGHLELLRKEPVAAEGHFARALAAAETSARVAEGGDPELISDLRTGLGRSLARQGRAEEALELFERVYEELRTQLGEDHPTVIESANNLAVASGSAGDPTAAETLFRQLLERQRRLLGDSHRKLVPLYFNLAYVLVHQGKSAAGREQLREALRVAEVAVPESPDIVEIHLFAGLVEFWAGDSRAAADRYRSALELCRRIYSGPHRQTTVALGRLAFVSKSSDPIAAEELAREARSMARVAAPDLVADNVLTLAQAILANGRPAEARDTFAEAIELLAEADPWVRNMAETGLFEASLASDHPALACEAALRYVDRVDRHPASGHPGDSAIREHAEGCNEGTR